MGIIIGVDIGGSTTKVVGKDGDRIAHMLQVDTADQITSLYGGIGKLLHACDLTPADVTAVYLTGVGASFVDEQVHGIKTYKVPEFDAIAAGALRLSGLKEALVISMGTGTAFVRAADGENRHIGGTGVGGGTILGLASRLLRGRDIDAIVRLAEKGDNKNVDLLVGDILRSQTDTLMLEMTASNLGKMSGSASESDMAMGLINMVFETIGMMALFALQNDTINDVVLTGTLAAFPQAKTVFEAFVKMSGKNFVIPEDAMYATALGTLPENN